VAAVEATVRKMKRLRKAEAAHHDQQFLPQWGPVASLRKASWDNRTFKDNSQSIIQHYTNSRSTSRNSNHSAHRWVISWNRNKSIHSRTGNSSCLSHHRNHRKATNPRSTKN
jgi:hypothetical protein